MSMKRKPATETSKLSLFLLFTFDWKSMKSVKTEDQQDDGISCHDFV